MNFECIDWGLILTVIGTGIATLTFVYGFLRNFKQDIREWRAETKQDIRERRAETKEEIKSIRDEISEMREEFRLQTQRTDRLYEMFIDLIKNKNPKSDP